MVLIVADQLAHAELAAKQYQISRWRYISHACSLRGIDDTVVAIAGPAQYISYEMYQMIRSKEDAKRITMMRLLT